MKFSAIWLVVLLGLVQGAAAQVLVEDKNWVEGEVPQAPAFDAAHAIDVDTQGPSLLRIGVDPRTISIGKDNVVRLVVLGKDRSGNVLNALYAGIRCATAEYRVYARHYQDTAWKDLPDGTWKPMQDSTATGMMALRLARSGVCASTVPNGNAGAIAQALKTRPETQSN
jgi:CNP1-like family protein